MTGITQLLSRDALDDALAVAASDVKSKPKDASARKTLAELAIVAGDLARAETHLKMAATQSPQDAVGLGIMRAQLRGMHARIQWFADCAVPSFPNGPTQADHQAIKLQIALHGANDADAKDALTALEAATVPIAGTWNGLAFNDLRDLDDRFQHALEAISPGGAYLWIDLSLIRQITFMRPSSAMDLAWRKARVTLHDGSAADLLIPAIYPDANAADLKLGRRTDWIEAPGGTVVGTGQRTMLAAGTTHGLLEAEEVILTEIDG